MDVQLNIRCTEQTATAIKALAESTGLKLGALLEKLIASYQPDSALIPADCSAIDELRSTVADLESRLSALERRLSALERRPLTIAAPDSGLIAKDSTGEFNQDLAAFKAAVTDYWHSGLQGYGQIAAALTNAGYRNSGNNPYSREAVKRALKKAGLVA